MGILNYKQHRLPNKVPFRNILQEGKIKTIFKKI